MKKILMICLITCLVAASGCKDYLDVNKNPNAPENAAANLYLAPMLHWMVTSPQFDARFIGRYTQNWYLPTTAITTWDQQGYDTSSDNGGQLWRDVYWSLGHNLNRMITQAEAEQRWDVLGVGYILKAWGWQSLTDLHGEIIIKEAFDETKTSFKYDTQEFAYQEVQRLLTLAIANLQRTDGFVNQSYLAVGDKIYNGDRSKWIKFAYGLLAINLNHYSNKTGVYNPDAVIDAVNKSFASNIDNALLAYSNTANDDTNFFGPRRQNMQNYRQTQFIVNLLNGSQFGGVDDPRRTRMLAPSPDGQYRGLDINIINFGTLTTAQRPNNIWGYAANISSGVKTTYIFDDKSIMPGMTYSQLQFIKAEAAYKKGDKTTALTAYTNGVSAHIDFVNERNLDNKQLPTQITPTEKATFLANPNIIPTAANLNLSQIMSQKYIAQWGWGHLETWMDLRRYGYTNVEALTGKQVFLGFGVPTALFGDNGGKTVQRIRPRYNSEYVWNIKSLEEIGGLATDYQTKPLWIIQP
ncbi:RagB/SusD family nutrient uptake outer membrane protein [Pedobacter cryophilus]|uniref:RagB/SusD family nutrient uptake outer membrane protein n=1 Tax=Pedobacter cryophilus TaxID=2571271 RepID=A0A4U1C5Z7_9SPHI|nr:RagB/SusD family nutrient uptake outer membrane protein [Pedobacter cryophilus]TKC00735.1 RagB/SusD family nutrient uptake outer membrane protein [Pedobacter cryophilus]